MELLVCSFWEVINGLARRHFSEKNGTQQVQSPGTGKDGEVAAPDSPSNKSVGGVQAPSDPMAERPTPCIKTISTSVSRAQLEAVPPFLILSDCLVTGRCRRLQVFKYQ
jgi:hypothetical protein